MSIVQINKDQLADAKTNISNLAFVLNNAVNETSKGGQLASFTRVSGLDQLGSEHAGVLVSGPGSARGVAQGLGRIVEGLACGLGATVEGFCLQEDVFTHSLTTVHSAATTTGAASGVASGGVGVTVPESITPVPVVVGPKSVVPPQSVVGLLRDYFTTQTAAIGQASTSWEALSTTMQDVAVRLRGVANDIQAANRGEVIDAVVDRIRVTSGVAASFAGNAQAMGVWASRMGWTHKLGVAEAAMMNATVMANMVPGVRQVQERLALAAYARFAMPPLLSLAEPRVGSLIDSSVPPATGGLLEAELEETASLSQEVLKDHIDRIREGKPDRVLVEDVHRMQEAATHGGSTSGDGVTPAGGVVSGGDAVTRTQGVPQLSSPSLGGAGGGVPGAAGTGVAVNGGVPAGGGGGAGRGGAVPVAAGAPGAGSSAGAPRRGGGSGSRVRPASLMPTTPATSGGGRGGSSRVGAGSRRRAAGVGAGFGVGAGVGAGLLAAGGAGAGVGSGAAGAVPGAASSAGGGAGRAGGSRAGAGRGVMPWGMAPAGGREKKSRNIKTVLPELEQDANTRAIVGDAPPMVPGPIGAWAKSGPAPLR